MSEKSDSSASSNKLLPVKLGDCRIAWGSFYDLNTRDISTGWHHENHAVFGMSLGGSVWIVSESMAYLFAPGTALFTHPGPSHRELSIGPRNKGYFVSLDGKECPPTFSRIKLIKNSEEIESLFKQIVGWRPEKDLDQSHHEVLNQLIEKFEKAEDLHLFSLQLPKSKDLIELSVSVLKDRFTKLTVPEWAKHVAQSERTLSRRFMAETGMTLATWQTKAKALVAASMLFDKFSIPEITKQLGYRHTSTFIAVFQRHWGRSPLQFLKQFLGG